MGGFYRRGSSRGNNSNFTRLDKRRDSDMPVGDVIYSGYIYKECENDLVIKSQLENTVPYFNGRIFLENKEEIGKVDEILGKVTDYYFSVRLKEGILAKSFSKDTKLYIDSNQILPISRFISQPMNSVTAVKKKKKNNRDVKKKGGETNGMNRSDRSGFKSNFRGSGRGGFQNRRGGGSGSGGRGNNNKGNSGRRNSFNNRGSGNNRFSNKRGKF